MAANPPPWRRFHCSAGSPATGERRAARAYRRSSDGSIFPAVVKQRIASAHHYLFDFRDKNRMVARVLRAMQPALKIGERAVQHRRTVRGAIEMRPRLPFGMAMVLGRARIVFRNDALIFRQNIHSKPLLGMQMSVGAGALVDADQYQRRIERDGTERVRGHAVHFALVVHCNHRHSGRKAAQGAPEFCLSNGHLKAGTLPFRIV